MTRQCFTEANLQSASLANTRLINADFTNANLSDADLSNAKLDEAVFTEANLVGANLQKAFLTGACLKAWNIDSNTRLDGVVAEYVYLAANQEQRRPPSGCFKEGEFAKLFRKALDTVDLIFRKGPDWLALSISLKNIKDEKKYQDISIDSILNKEDGMIVVRFKVPPDIDKDRVPNNLHICF